MTDNSWRPLYPFASHWLDLGGVRLHYLDEGPRDADETVLMVHGNPTWSFYYRNLVAGLRDRWRCVAPDHVGCGLSDKPQRRDYTLESRIADLERLATELDLRDITLVVHDWGGPIGVGFALRHPDRVRRLVVLNTSAFLSDRIPCRIDVLRRPVLGPLIIRGLNGFAWPALRMATTPDKPLPPGVRAGYLAPYDSWANRVAVLRFVQDIPMSPDHPTYPLMKSIGEQSARLAALPMMLCWGMLDFCFSPHFLGLWRERFPRAAVHEFADAGHYVLENAGERILPLVRSFIAGAP